MDCTAVVLLWKLSKNPRVEFLVPRYREDQNKEELLHNATTRKVTESIFREPIKTEYVTFTMNLNKNGNGEVHSILDVSDYQSELRCNARFGYVMSYCLSLSASLTLMLNSDGDSLHEIVQSRPSNPNVRKSFRHRLPIELRFATTDFRR